MALCLIGCKKEDVATDAVTAEVAEDAAQVDVADDATAVSGDVTVTVAQDATVVAD